MVYCYKTLIDGQIVKQIATADNELGLQLIAEHTGLLPSFAELGYKFIRQCSFNFTNRPENIVINIGEEFTKIDSLPGIMGKMTGDFGRKVYEFYLTAEINGPKVNGLVN